MGADACGSCPQGKFAIDRSATCSVCPPGTYQGLPRRAECIACNPGQYTTLESSKSSCRLCPAGTYNTKVGSTAEAECVLCALEIPHTTTKREGAVTQDECVCEVGFYGKGDSSNRTCHICPTGALCTEIGLQLKNAPALAGYFRNKNTSTSWFECVGNKPEARDQNGAGKTRKRKKSTQDLGDGAEEVPDEFFWYDSEVFPEYATQARATVCSDVNCSNVSIVDWDCVGGTTQDQCAPGTKGVLCHACEDGFTRGTNTQCQPCDATQITVSPKIFFGVLGCLGLIFLSLLVARFMCQDDAGLHQATEQVNASKKTVDAQSLPSHRFRVLIDFHWRDSRRCQVELVCAGMRCGFKT